MSIFGIKVFNGCCDSDGDGIGDDKDKCLDEVGLLKYEGCLMFDWDKDGFFDVEDCCLD